MKASLSDTARRLPLAAGLALALAAAACSGPAGTPRGAPVPTTTATEPSTPAPTSAAPSRSTPTPDRRAPTRPSGQTGPDRCHTADLTARLAMLDSAAGSRYAALILQNRSTGTCRVYGYGGVQLLDAARRPLPTHQLRDPSTPPHRVLLRPGGSANSRLHWHPIPSSTESQTGPCQPTPSYLLVTPPDETQPITVAWPFGVVCAEGTLGQTSYAPGTTPRD